MNQSQRGERTVRLSNNNTGSSTWQPAPPPSWQPAPPNLATCPSKPGNLPPTPTWQPAPQNLATCPPPQPGNLPLQTWQPAPHPNLATCPPKPGNLPNLATLQPNLVKIFPTPPPRREGGWGEGMCVWMCVGGIGCAGRVRDVVVDFMILFRGISSRRSVHQKELFIRSFVRSFSRVSGSGESFSESFQTHFLPPPLVLIRESRMPAESFRLTSSLRPSFSFANRECQPSRSDSLPPSVPRSRSRIANASRVVQTHFLPRSQHSNESRMHNAVLTESLSDSLVLISQTNHEITIHNRAMVQMVINQHNMN